MTQTTKLAASVVLRPTPGDERVYLVRRNPKLRWFAGFWAFPGGTVGQADLDATMVGKAELDATTGSEDLEKPGERRASVVEGVDGEMAAFVLAAARELLEETGLSFHGESEADRKAWREATLEDEAAFVRSLNRHARSVPGNRFEPIARLLTPDFHPVRFDTVFFRVDLTAEPRQSESPETPLGPKQHECSEMPTLPEPTIWEGELVEGAWDTPANWLRKWREGLVHLAPPMVLMLQVFEARGHDGATEELRELSEGFARGKLHPIYYNPAIQLLPLRTPTLPPATHTNAYLVGNDPAYLIDPATPHEDERARLVEALEEAAALGRRPSAIVLTHHHPDHVGAVDFVRERYGLPVWAHAITADLLKGEIKVDRRLEHGERLPLGTSPSGATGWELECHFTPGHAAGHLCFFEREYGSLIAGDMVSTLSSILVHPDDGDMAQYMESLENLTRLRVRMVLPSHGPGSSQGTGLLEKQLEHRRMREASVVACLDDGLGEMSLIVQRVYEGLPREMHDYAALSVRSILNKLSAEGSAEAEGVS